MKNEESLLLLRIQLMEEGKIGTTGARIIYNGEEIDEPEQLHTAYEWKRRGREPISGEEGYRIKLWIPRMNNGGARGMFQRWCQVYTADQTKPVG